MKKNINLKQQIPKQVLIPFALAVGGLLLGLIGYVGFVSPAKSRLATVNKELAVARVSLITAENTPPPPKLPPAQATDIFQLTKAMPSTDDWPGILIAVSDLAKRSSVMLAKITPGNDVTGVGYNEVPVSVDISGSYTAVTHFLRAVHQTATVTPTELKVRGRLFLATGVTLGSPNGKNVEATVTMNAFTYVPAASTTTTATTTTTPATP